MGGKYDNWRGFGKVGAKPKTKLHITTYDKKLWTKIANENEGYVRKVDDYSALRKADYKRRQEAWRKKRHK